MEQNDPTYGASGPAYVENAIRPTKLGQKNWLVRGNGESGCKCAILYTIVENCRRLKIDVREYLTDVLT